jgi:hypothetical protein
MITVGLFLLSDLGSRIKLGSMLCKLRSNPHDHAAFGCFCLYRGQMNPLQLRRSSISATH